MAPPSARSPWAVLASTSLAVFAVFLDTTILFVAFPSIQADFSDVGPSTAVVGAQRLHDRVRRAAHPRRPAGRPHRAAADVPGRGRPVHDRLDAVRRGPDGRAPGRGPGPAGGRGRGAGALVAGPRAADLPALRRSRSRWPSGVRSVPSPVRPDRRSARWSSRTSAGAGPSSSTCPSGSSASSSAAGCCPKDGRPTPAGCPTRSVWCCWPAGWRWPPSASS